MTPIQKTLKRIFDLFAAFLGLLFTLPIILILALLVFLETRSNGFYSDIRIGRHGKPFRMYKIRSMRPAQSPPHPPHTSHLIPHTTITTANNPRITKIGRIIRKTKLDELPQLWNVLLGHMSFVGPRPDVPGFADKLQGEDRIILSLRPGITGPATLAFRNEENLLAQQENPEQYNWKVIWPEKVKINKEYIRNYSLARDIKIIWNTVFS